MEQRFIIILSGIGVVVLLSVFTYFWRQGDEKPAIGQDATSTTEEGQGSASSTESREGATDSDSPAEEMDVEELMNEIEAAADGDEGALESEYAAENESFMEGAVVMEQLGTSYDETAY